MILINYRYDIVKKNQLLQKEKLEGYIIVLMEISKVSWKLWKQKVNYWYSLYR